jgi:DNA-binding MarR family transcriptional regulator
MAEKKLISEMKIVHPIFRDKLCYSLSKTGILMRAILERSLEGYKLVPQQAGILQILAGYGEYNQLLLSQEMGIDKASMVKFIDGLESKKLVQRKTDPNDRRSKFVTITEKGKVLQREIAKIHDKLEKDLLQDFTKEEVQILRKLMPEILGSVINYIHKE